MRIDVTQEDIDLGTLGDCELCAASRAIERAAGPGYLVGADDVVKNHTDLVWKLPSIAIRFIAYMDRGYPVRPFSFDIDLPEKDAQP